MRFFVGDYMADTIGLTKAEHGSYVLAIFKYWQKGEALTDAEMMEVAGRERLRVQTFFVWEGERWHHKRIDAEIADDLARMAAATAKASKAARARWGKVQP